MNLPTRSDRNHTGLVRYFDLGPDHTLPDTFKQGLRNLPSRWIARRCDPLFEQFLPPIWDFHVADACPYSRFNPMKLPGWNLEWFLRGWPPHSTVLAYDDTVAHHGNDYGATGCGATDYGPTNHGVIAYGAPRIGTIPIYDATVCSPPNYEPTAHLTTVATSSRYEPAALQPPQHARPSCPSRRNIGILSRRTRTQAIPNHNPQQLSSHPQHNYTLSQAQTEIQTQAQTESQTQAQAQS